MSIKSTCFDCGARTVDGITEHAGDCATARTQELKALKSGKFGIIDGGVRIFRVAPPRKRKD